MKSLAEFRQDAGIKLNLKKLAAQGELPKGQERVAWAMYVRKNTAQDSLSVLLPPAESFAFSRNQKIKVCFVKSRLLSLQPISEGEIIPPQHWPQRSHRNDRCTYHMRGRYGEAYGMHRRNT